MRNLDTYRGARRNAARDGAGIQTFRPLAGKRDRVMSAPRYEPYLIKPPTMKYIYGVPTLVPRKQPRIYPAGWRSANERAQ